MNKKGFTLIELIITIALIGFVGVVLSVNMVKVINNQKEEEEAKAVELIEEAGCAYASLSTSNCDSGCTISGETLVDNGLIDEKISNTIVADYSVSITYQNGERICSASK